MLCGVSWGAVSRRGASFFILSIGSNMSQVSNREKSGGEGPQAGTLKTSAARLFSLYIPNPNSLQPIVVQRYLHLRQSDAVRCVKPGITFTKMVVVHEPGAQGQTET